MGTVVVNLQQLIDPLIVAASKDPLIVATSPLQLTSSLLGMQKFTNKIGKQLPC